MLLYMLDAYYSYNNDIIPLVLARTQSYSLNQTLTLSYIKSEISIKIPAFEQIIGKLSFLSFSLAELEVFSFPSSSTEFSAA